MTYSIYLQNGYIYFQVGTTVLGSSAISGVAGGASSLSNLYFVCAGFTANTDFAINFLSLSTLAPTDYLPQLKTQVNGQDVCEFKPYRHYVDLAHYYHTPFGFQPTMDGVTPQVGLVTFCLDTSRFQPTGTLNFSRLDTYKLVVPAGYYLSQLISSTYIYALSYNILKFYNGQASLLYAN
jgi:hypothetical protein